MLSHVQLFATQWTIACQAPLSMGFSRQEYPSGLPCPPPGDLLDPGIGLASPALQVDSLPPSHQGSPLEAQKWALPFLTFLLIGVTASALTRGSVKSQDRSLLDCTSGGVFSRPASGPGLPLQTFVTTRWEGCCARWAAISGWIRWWREWVWKPQGWVLSCSVQV